MGLFDFLFVKNKLTLEEADKLNDKILSQNPGPKNEEDELSQRASKCMTSGRFSESLELYKKLSEGYPHNKGDYESQVGAAYYFLGEYEKAIERLHQ